jgi:hypothetical protein
VEDPSVNTRLVSDLISLVQGWQAKHGWLALDEILTDHHIDNYIAALTKLAKLAPARMEVAA